MSLWEHILYLFAAFHIPVGNVVFLKGVIYGIVKKLFGVALTCYFHYFKGETRLYPFVEQINHYIVTGTYYFGNSTCTVGDKILGIAHIYVGSVRKTRNLQKVGKKFGL